MEIPEALTSRPALASATRSAEERGNTSAGMVGRFGLMLMNAYSNLGSNIQGALENAREHYQVLQKRENKEKTLADYQGEFYENEIKYFKDSGLTDYLIERHGSVVGQAMLNFDEIQEILLKPKAVIAYTNLKNQMLRDVIKQCLPPDKKNTYGMDCLLYTSDAADEP